MEVLLNIEEYHYNDSYPGEIYKYKSVGAVVVVHEANQMPFPEQRGIFVSPGTAVDIKVTKVADWITKMKSMTDTMCRCVVERVMIGRLCNIFLGYLHFRFGCETRKYLETP